MKEVRAILDDDVSKALDEDCKNENRVRKYQVNIVLREHYKRKGLLQKVTK